MKKEFTHTAISNLLNNIHKGINEINRLTPNRDDIKVSMPHYFQITITLALKDIYGAYSNASFQITETGLLKIFGIEIINNYDNSIVIFHKDSPMYDDLEYYKIELI